MTLTKMPTGEYALTLNSRELHDLLTVAKISDAAMHKALETSTHPWANRGDNVQTHGVYVLLARIVKAGNEAIK